MCFSASASFTAAAILSTMGIATISLAPRSLRFFAATPFFFALQQASEGVVWLHVASQDQWCTIATYTFLFFATIFWPVWIPLVLAYREPNKTRKNIIMMTGLVGIIFSLISIYFLILHDVQASAMGNHISYTYPDMQIPMPEWIAKILYCIAVILPCFVSSLSRVWIIGIGIIASYVLAYLQYRAHFGSTWCFFAALISTLIGYVVWYNKRYNNKKGSPSRKL